MLEILAGDDHPLCPPQPQRLADGTGALTPLRTSPCSPLLLTSHVSGGFRSRFIETICPIYELFRPAWFCLLTSAETMGWDFGARWTQAQRLLVR
jgi:hypothetical protein